MSDEASRTTDDVKPPRTRRRVDVNVQVVVTTREATEQNTLLYRRRVESKIDRFARIRDSSSFPAFSFSTKPRLFYRRRRPTFSRPPAVARVCVSRLSCARANITDTSSAPRRNHETRRALSDSSCKTASGARLDRLLSNGGTVFARAAEDDGRRSRTARPRPRRWRRSTASSTSASPDDTIVGVPKCETTRTAVPPRRKTIFAVRSVRARRRRRRRRRAVRSGTRGGARDDVARSPFHTRGVRSRAWSATRGF